MKPKKKFTFYDEASSPISPFGVTPMIMGLLLKPKNTFRNLNKFAKLGCKDKKEPFCYILIFFDHEVEIVDVVQTT